MAVCHIQDWLVMVARYKNFRILKKIGVGGGGQQNNLFVWPNGSQPCVVYR